MTDQIHQARAAGQSIWLDFLSRDMLQSGELGRLVEAGHLTGITSNPTIFNKAISGSDLYEEDLRRLREKKTGDAYAAFVELASADIAAACDLLRPVYDETGGRDGFVSLELPPPMANDVEASTKEARALFERIDRPNLMIKAPGTTEGVEILRRLTAEGRNINQTLLFSVDRYEETAEAYISALEERLERGLPIERIGSVASFFVSRVDTSVDEQLPDDSPLRGKAAIANAREAYRRFQRIFSGARWERLANAGGRVQRPLWASMSTKNPEYSDVLYVESLVASDTVSTIPESTMKALLDHGHIKAMTGEEIAAGRGTLAEIEAAGISIQSVTDQLLIDGLEAFDKDFQSLLKTIASELSPAASRA